MAAVAFGCGVGIVVDSFFGAVGAGTFVLLLGTLSIGLLCWGSSWRRFPLVLVVLCWRGSWLGLIGGLGELFWGVFFSWVFPFGVAPLEGH